jgi:pimeloyl-ACP methyl ester carboxylesterase
MSLDDLRKRWPTSRLAVQGHDCEILRTQGSDGLPVLWLPGAQGTAESFYRQFLAWGDRRPMAAFSYPALIGGAELADAVVAAADALGMPQFDLVGTSLGGHVAQWVAARHPQRVHRLVVGNSFRDPAGAQSPEKLQAVEGRDAETLHAEAMARLQAAPAGELRDVQLVLVGQRQPPALLRARMLAVQRATTPPPLGTADDRLLLIECDNDPLIPPPMRADLRHAHPGARSVVIEGGGHYPYILRADAYNAQLADFLGL